jgi:hypothetical protein
MTFRSDDTETDIWILGTSTHMIKGSPRGNEWHVGNGSCQWRKVLRRAAGVIPADPLRAWLAEAADGPEEARVLACTSGDDGYSWPGCVGAVSYAGNLDLDLDFLREGGGVERVSFELARLDATASSSSVSEELGSFGRENRLAGGTITEESAVVDDNGMRTELCKECRPEEELASGAGTLYRGRGLVRGDSLGLATALLDRAGGGAPYGSRGVALGGGGCDKEGTAIGTNPGGSWPSRNAMTVGTAPPAVLEELSWGDIPDDIGSETDVETLGEMGRWAASSALRNARWDTDGVA